MCHFDLFKPRWEYVHCCGECLARPCDLVTIGWQILYGNPEKIIWTEYDESCDSVSYK